LQNAEEAAGTLSQDTLSSNPYHITEERRMFVGCFVMEYWEELMNRDGLGA
jgi:hypothetical protein